MVRARIAARVRGRAVRAGVCVALMMAGAARADDAGVEKALARARAERGALRYRQALDEIERAMGRGAASPAQMAEMYRTAGELAAGLDEPTSAQRWFARWLLIVPDARLPADASPKLRQPMDAARAEVGGARLALRVDAGGRVVRVHVTGDALGLVRRVRVRALDGGPAQEGLPGEPIALAERATIAATVAAALDEHGNELITRPLGARGTGDGPRGGGDGSGSGGSGGDGAGDGRGTGGEAGGARGSRSIVARWETWAIASGAMAISGGVFAWRTEVAQDEFDRLRGESGLHTFAELEDVRRRGERNALVANVAFGAAAASAVAAGVLWLRARDGGDDDGAGAAGVRIAPAIAPGHAGVAVTARF